MQQNSSFDTIVIGAGISGISAAIESVKQGNQTLLLESTGYIGGRARSFIDEKTGDHIDNGQHAMMGCYDNFLGILKDLGTYDLIKKQKTLSVPFVYANGKKDILHAASPGPIGMAKGMLKLNAISKKEKWHLILFAARLQFNMCKPGSMTALEFLMSEFQSEHVIEIVWTPIILATLNGEPEKVSATLFVTVLKLAFFGKADASSLLFSTVGLSALFEPIIDWMHLRNSECRVSSPVKELLIADGIAHGVLLHDGSVIYAKKIISAITPKAFMRILPEDLINHEYFSAAHDYEFSPIISLYLWFDIPFPKIDFAAMLHTSTQWVFNKRAIMNIKKETSLLALTISAGDAIVQQSTEEIAMHCAGEIKKCFPEMENANLIHWKVIKEKSATFLASPEMEEKRLSQKTPIKGLTLAGDWTDTKLPATLEGAALSGKLAAQMH